ncbi:MAG: hypothetical protein IJ043_00290 [Clostridia bacterium]|nr:hypothetical protein [Clostridia bacterium]
MRKLIILLLLLLFAAAVLWGVNSAAAGTHEIMGDYGYQPFFQRLF